MFVLFSTIVAIILSVLDRIIGTDFGGRSGGGWLSSLY